MSFSFNNIANTEGALKPRMGWEVLEHLFSIDLYQREPRAHTAGPPKLARPLHRFFEVAPLNLDCDGDRQTIVLKEK